MLLLQVYLATKPKQGLPHPRHPIFKGGCQPEFSSMAPPPCPSTTQCTVGGEALGGGAQHPPPQASSRVIQSRACAHGWVMRIPDPPGAHTQRTQEEEVREAKQRAEFLLLKSAILLRKQWMGQAIMGEVTPKGDRTHAAAFVPVKLTQEPPEVPLVPDPGVSENSVLQNKNISANNLS